jgi:hypothetical protein
LTDERDGNGNDRQTAKDKKSGFLGIAQQGFGARDPHHGLDRYFIDRPIDDENAGHHL